jgi:hypothetical protein
MGDRHLPLPEMGGRTLPVARPLAVQPAVPSGMAHDPANGYIKALPVALPVKPGAALVASTPHSSHKPKKEKAQKIVVATPELSNPPEDAPEATPPAKEPSESSKGSSTSSGPLTLREPATPAPSPDADKAPPEPDEPPTVNAPAAGSAGPAASTNASSSSERQP